MIRRATDADVPRLVEMGRAFLAGTRYAGAIRENPAQMAETAAGLIASEAGELLVAERGGQVVGMIGLLLYTHPLSGDRVASELFWWVDPDHRGQGIALLRAGERWARACGAVALQMIAPSDDVERLYERLGFVRIEAQYQRGLS